MTYLLERLHTLNEPTFTIHQLQECLSQLAVRLAEVDAGGEDSSHRIAPLIESIAPCSQMDTARKTLLKELLT